MPRSATPGPESSYCTEFPSAIYLSSAKKQKQDAVFHPLVAFHDPMKMLSVMASSLKHYVPCPEHQFLLFLNHIILN